jgi:predicted TPR repeat methyltransferase
MTRLPLVDRVDHLLTACRGKRVLHLGCTNWPYTAASFADQSLLHLRLLGVAAELWGVDADADGLEALANRGVSRLIQADVEHLERAELPGPFEVIVAGEIIEHLSNPGLFLDGVARCMNAESRLLLTSINAYCGMRAVQYALRGRGGRAEPVHPDHVAYYSYATIRHLLDHHGFRVDGFWFYDVGPEHRPYNRFYLNWINDVCVRLAHQLADGVIVECVRS